MSHALINSLAIVTIGAIITFGMTLFWRRVDKKVRVAEAEKRAIKEEAERLVRVAEEKAAVVKRSHDELQATVRDLQTKVTTFEQVAVPLNELMKKALIRELTHDHLPREDELLSKIGGPDDAGVIHPNTLTEAEEEELEKILTERVETLNGRIDRFELDAAIMLPMVIRRAKRDVDAVAHNIPQELKLVTVVEPEPAEPQE